MFNVRMFLLLVVIVFCSVDTTPVRKRTGDSANQLEDVSKTSKLYPTSTATSPAPAIIAIEIVDAPQNKSLKGKNNSKRTIESALGYGYHNNYNNDHQKKFVIYKYSQQSIPSPTYYKQDKEYASQVEIQRAIEKPFPSTSYVQPAVEVNVPRPVYGPPGNAYYNQYNPGNIVYTTLNHQGQLGGLSTQVPYQNYRQAQVVPVILLRVYSDQLDNSQAALHTNLPQANPYASLNNINLQSLLRDYVQQYLQSQQTTTAPYQLANYQQYYQPQPTYYTEQNEPQVNLPTYENYPSEQHTRVIFHSNNNGHIPVPKQMYQTPGLSTYRTVSVPRYVAPAFNTQYQYVYEPQQNIQQQYYLYPVQTDKGADAYYQQEQAEQQYEQQEDRYQVSESNRPNYDTIPGQSNNVQTETEENTPPPYNYHAHSDDSSIGRGQLQDVEVSSTLPPKRRELRNQSEDKSA